MSRDGKYWLPMGVFNDSTGMLYDLMQKDARPTLLQGHKRGLNDAAFSNDGVHVLTGSSDKTARLWNLSKQPATSVVLEGHQNSVDCVALSNDGKYALTGSSDCKARLWNLTQNPVTSVVLDGPGHNIEAVAFSNSGTHALTAGGSCVLLWNIKDVPVLCAELVNMNERVISVAFSPDDRYILTGTYHGAIRLWDRIACEAKQESEKRLWGPIRDSSWPSYKNRWSVTKEIVRPYQAAASTAIKSIAVSKEGRYALACCQSRAYLIDLHTLTCSEFESISGLNNSATFSPDFKSFAIDAYQYPFYALAEIVSLEQLFLLIKAHSHPGLAPKIRETCAVLICALQLENAEASKEKLTQLCSTNPLIATMATLSLEVLTILSLYNSYARFELPAETLHEDTHRALNAIHEYVHSGFYGL